jgi:haloalkane dehalogenase
MADVEGTRIHFVDEGDGPLVLLMHGNPTWSYLWRKVIARLAGRGVRCVAPDLMGLGLSDKPRSPRAHQLARHIALIRGLVEALDPDDLIVVGQDWGGPIATGVGHALSDRVRGMVLANTSVLPPARPFRSKPFHRFSHLPVISDVVFRGLLFPVPVLRSVQGDRGSIGPRQLAAYAWPLANPLDRAAPLGLARMVPDAESHPSTPVLDEVGAWVERWEGPAALVWGRRDPILGRAMRRHQRVLPQATIRESEAGHFLQEEVPDLLAEAILEVSST